MMRARCCSTGSTARSARTPARRVTRPQVLAQLVEWEDAGVAASSINHRLRELRALYRVLDSNDPTAYNPTFDIKKRSEPEPEPRAVSYDLIEAIIAYMPDRGRTTTAGTTRPMASQTKGPRARDGLDGTAARSGDEDSTGARRLAGAHAGVTPRRKGKGTKARTIPLLPEAVEALRCVLRGRRDGQVLDVGVLQDVADRAAASRARAPAPRRRAGHRSAHDRPAAHLALRSPALIRNGGGAPHEQPARRADADAARAVSTTERYLKSALEQSAQAVIEKWGGASWGGVVVND
jgi:integrase